MKKVLIKYDEVKYHAGLTFADPPPVLRHWQLVLTSTQVLVKVLAQGKLMYRNTNTVC